MAEMTVGVQGKGPSSQSQEAWDLWCIESACEIRILRLDPVRQTNKLAELDMQSKQATVTKRLPGLLQLRTKDKEPGSLTIDVGAARWDFEQVTRDGVWRGVGSCAPELAQ